MLYVAFNGGIKSTDVVEDGHIEITALQYDYALTAILSGSSIAVSDGEMKIARPATEAEPVPPTPLTLSEKRTAAAGRILLTLKIISDRMTDSYPSGEVASWPSKIAESRAYLIDSKTPTPILSVEASMMKTTVAIMAQKVITNGAAYERATAALAAIRQISIAQFDAATSSEAIASAEAQIMTTIGAAFPSQN